MALIYRSYFPNITNYLVFINSNKVCFEIHDNYQKQTYRNRCYLYGANGIMGLHIPVHYTQNNRQKTGEIKIDNSSSWKSTHWKSLESAYSTSPFFEFYKDDLRPLFQTKTDFLLPFLFECMERINQCLEFEFTYSTSNRFEKECVDDYRFLVDARSKTVVHTKPYIQVFQHKFGYLNNLSVLDLLFNLGPEALPYLLAHPPVKMDQSDGISTTAEMGK